MKVKRIRKVDWPGLLLLLLLGCEFEQRTEWDDESGIATCERVVDHCASFCDESIAAGDYVCADPLYDDCADLTRSVDGLVDRVEGLHGRLADDVVMQRKPTCFEAMRFLPAWRYGDSEYE